MARALVAACCLSPVLAQTPPSVAPPQALVGVRLLDQEGTRTILVRDGRIERVLAADTPVPVGYERVEAEGLVAAPAFLDAYSHAGCATPEPLVDQDRPVDVGAGVRTDMRAANRKGVQPGFRAAEVLALDDKTVEAWHAAGFGALVSAPHGELLAGTSALALLRDAARRDQVLRGDVFQHAAFQANGPGYPSTLMGFHAQLRQFLLDAAHQRELVARWEAGRSGPRPPHDELLERAWPLLDGSTLLVCEAETARDVHRWLGLAEEFGLRIAVAGGRDAWKAAGALAQRGVPVVLTLDWGDEVDDPRAPKDEGGKGPGRRGKGDAGDATEGTGTDPEQGDDVPSEPVDVPQVGDAPPADSPADTPAEGGSATETPTAEDAPPVDWTYQEPFGVRLDRRLRWEERRDTALRLSEAGVTVYFGTGAGKPRDLLEHVRTLHGLGLSREAALGALTAGAAGWTRAGRALGGLEPGASANLVLWTADPLEEGAQVRHVLVDGHRHDYEVKAKAAGAGPAKGVDLNGTWSVTTDDEDDPPTTLVLEMEADGSVTGELRMKDPSDGSDVRGEVRGSVDGEQVSLEATVLVAGLQVSIALEGKWADGGFAGDSEVRFGGQSQGAKFEAKRVDDQGGQR